MSQINEIIADYLSAPNTDFAIMISGEWGCGKSHYIRHDFIDLVKGIEIPETADKDKKQKKAKYNPAFISLYGVSSAEDFEYRVFCGINSWAEKGIIRVGGALVAKGASFFGIELGKKDSSAITFVGENRVLVFDDLERICDDKIPVKEVLGLINSYAEHTHRKVIIVCNEEHFLEDADLRDDYLKYKEKSVRFTYTYKANVESVYDAMVSELAESEYSDYLRITKPEVLSLFSLGGNTNLRTLKFFIDTFKEIYNTALGAKYEKQIISSYVLSFMLYAIEQKAGHSKDELESLDTSKYKIDTSFFRSFRQDNEVQQEGEEMNYPSKFEQKYQTVFSQFRPNRMFVDYIFSGYLDKEALMNDIAAIVADFDRQVLTPEGKVYRSLSMMTLIKDEDVKPLIEEMLSYVKADKYNLYDLLNVYALLLKYDYWKIVGFELTDDIDAEFTASMDRQQSRHLFNNMFEVRTPYFENTTDSQRQYQKYTAMKKHATGINWQAKKKRDITEGEVYVQVAKEGNLEKLRKYRDSSDSRISVEGIDWKEIVSILLTASNPVACEVCDDIITFVPDGGVVSPDERDRLKAELLPAIEEYFKSDDNRLRRVYINELRNHLNEVLR